MTPTAQQTAIAEACGWTDIRNYTYSDDGTQALGGHRAGTPVGCWAWLPDYLNSLDDMHEAEEVLTPEQREIYASVLADVCKENRYGDDPIRVPEKGSYIGYIEMPADRTFLVYHATAAQRAEAFLRTLGKWTD